MFKITLVFALLGVAFGAPTAQEESSPNLEIVGGHDANIQNFPWQISLQYRGSHFCGGFLISNTWVVTAAHCIVQGYSSNLNIRAGSSYKSLGGQSVNVKSFIIHPNYDGDVTNDIALLELSSAVSFGNAVRAAKLPVAGQVVADNVDVTVTGWGALRENGASSTVLQEVTIPSVSRSVCRAAYGSSLITNQMFCAGLLGVGGKDSCQGDSGGPAVINGEVAGVVSWGYGCASARYPGVYAKVSAYRNWIRQNTGV